MDTMDVERIRKPNFPVARRGYEQREVDNFLLALADWLEDGGRSEAESYAVTRKLQRAGETTARVLATAQAEADQIRQEAEAEARKAIAEAQQAARQRTDTAKEHARAILDEAERRRATIEGQIHELDTQRRRAIEELVRLRDALTNALAQQQIAARRPEAAPPPPAPRRDGPAAGAAAPAPRQPARR